MTVLTEKQASRLNQSVMNRKGVPAMPDTLRAASASPAAPATLGPAPDYAPPFPYEVPATMQIGALNTLRMLGNAPYSGYKVGEALYDAGTSPVETGSAILRTIAGSGEEVHRRFLGGPETGNAQMFRQVAGGLKDRLMNPGRTLVEDPMGMAMDIPGIGSPLARIAGQGKVATALQRINPAQGMTSAIESTAKIPNVARAALVQAQSFTTGFPHRAFTKIFEAGKKGGESLTRATRTLRERRFLEEIGGDLKEALGDLKVQKSKDYTQSQAAWDWIDPANTVDLNDLRGKVLGIAYEEFNLQPKITTSGTFNGFTSRTTPKHPTKINRQGELNRIEKVAREVMDWTDTTPQGLDILKQRIDKLYVNGDQFKDSNRFVSATRKELRDELGEKVGKYNETERAYSDFKGQMKELDEVFRVEGPMEGTINRLTTLFDEPANMDLRRRVMKDLEETIARDPSYEVAGAILSQWAPKGLIGRSAAAGLIAVSSATQVFELMALLPFTSPRAIGELMRSLGMGARKVELATKTLRNIHNAVPSGMVTEGLTTAAVADRLIDGNRMAAVAVPVPPSPDELEEPLGVAGRLMGRKFEE